MLAFNKTPPGILEHALVSYLNTSKIVKLEKHSENLLKTRYTPGIPNNYLTRIIVQISKPPLKQLIFGLMADKIVFLKIAGGLTFQNTAIYLVLKQNNSVYLRYLRRKIITVPPCLFHSNDNTAEFFYDDAIADVNSKRNKISILRQLDTMTILINEDPFMVMTFNDRDQMASADIFYQKLQTILCHLNNAEASFGTLQTSLPLTSGLIVALKEIPVKWNKKSATELERKRDDNLVTYFILVCKNWWRGNQH